MLYVAVVEDNPASCRLLKEYIETDDVKVSSIYTSGEDALRLVPTLPLPDIVLVDIGLPGISGVEVIRKLRELFPELEIVVQTVFEDTRTIMDTIKAGASGYILKASSREEYAMALREIKKGGSFLTGKIARKILEEFRGQGNEKGRSFKRFDLTEREEEILRELIKGLAYKTIAEKLHISIHTVNNHIRKIYQKLQVNSRAEAVAVATNQESS